jgi:invasion protein IalB
MKHLLKPISLAVLLAGGLTGAALAQETEAADGPTADASGLSMGEDADGTPELGQTYIRETHGDWEIRCVRTEDGNDPCQMYQLLSDQDGNSVAEISLFPLPAGQQAAAGATIITPLETLLTEQMRLAVDGGQNKRYPYTFCSAVGCFARLGFTAGEVTAFKRGANATLTIVPAAAPDQTVELGVSLSGFTAAYDSIEPTGR